MFSNVGSKSYCNRLLEQSKSIIVGGKLSKLVIRLREQYKYLSVNGRLSRLVI